MKEASEPSKIIDLNPRLGGQPSERGGELLQKTRDLARQWLAQHVNQVFEHVDDALFDLAEKAENNAAQMHYFDGMREVRKRRPALERNFLARVAQRLSSLGATAQLAPTTSSPIIGSLELSLVADSELEESLAATAMVSKAETRFHRELYAVNRRLSVIYGGSKVDDSNSPIGPSALTQAFRDAMADFEMDVRVKLIIYKLFERYTLGALDELYASVNALLADAGVLPQLRPESARPSESGTRQATEPTTENRTAATSTAIDPGEESPSAIELLQNLRTLLGARRPPSTVSASGSTSNEPLPSVNELVGALSVLQNQTAVSTHAANALLEVQELKQQLMSQLGALRGRRPEHVASIDEDTIDLVGMLFQFILEDRNLPTEMQALLGRLQIPYLKVAILDRKLFAHRQHPARRLLDALAEAAKSWSQESDRDGRLFGKVKTTVERVLHEFDDDLDIFQRLYDELISTQDAHAQRAELAEKRVAESTRGRERLEYARHRAAREILARIENRPLPPLVHGILTRAWANHLVLTILRQGETSAEYQHALRFVEDFIASTQPADRPESRQRLRALLPALEDSLRHGLANVAFQEPDINRLVTQLQAYYGNLLGETTASDAELSPADALLPIPDNVQPIMLEPAPLGDETATEASASDAALQRVQALKPGEWIEFTSRDGSPDRAKLSWISPMSGRYLFVNRRGLKACDFAPRELAQALDEGRARLIESAALFDRAMDAIVERLGHPNHIGNA